MVGRGGSATSRAACRQPLDTAPPRAAASGTGVLETTIQCFYRAFSNDCDNYFIIVSSATAKPYGHNGTIVGTIDESSTDPDIFTFLLHEQSRITPRRGETCAVIKQFPARSGLDFQRKPSKPGSRSIGRAMPTDNSGREKRVRRLIPAKASARRLKFRAS
ncbi:hypothetical protein NDN01_25110 [Sphingomonas sp. QA11]|uniref:hypothetical protein n=1 Tax=Sphingomonas sp. QA11 TaxID=2950605 RepID=UPI00234B58EE|nr:hypothetical protein [Sphingomonas sp. QA11]WCM27224.1 hypothetical protein NDN01_25110 [Sphingomonas sp. QA11]